MKKHLSPHYSQPPHVRLPLDNVLMDFKKEDQIVGISIEQSFLMSFVPLDFFQISSNGAHVLLRTFAPKSEEENFFFASKVFNFQCM